MKKKKIFGVFSLRVTVFALAFGFFVSLVKHVLFELNYLFSLNTCMYIHFTLTRFILYDIEFGMVFLFGKCNGLQRKHRLVKNMHNL